MGGRVGEEDGRRLRVQREHIKHVHPTTKISVSTQQNPRAYLYSVLLTLSQEETTLEIKKMTLAVHHKKLSNGKV